MNAPPIRHRKLSRGRGDPTLAAIVATVAVASLPAILRVVRTIPLRISLDANEGWNAYQAVAAAAGSLYPHPPTLFFNNYPPLSFYLVFGVSRWIGDPIVAGRLIACAAFGALAVLAGLSARRMRCTAGEAAFAAVLFVAATLSLSHYVGIDDPQFLGQAVAAAGLPLVIAEPRTTRRLWLAAALMSVGIFVKHNIVALPIACVAWLWMQDRAAAIRLVAAGACFAIAGLAVCMWVFGAGFLEGLTTPRGYSMTETVRAFVRWIVRMPVFIAALVLLLRRFPHDRHVTFCAWYAFVASIAGLAFLGGDGVDWNVMFESNWAWCVTAAVALNRLTPDSFVAQALGPANGHQATTHDSASSGHARWMLAVAFLLLPLVAATLAVRRASIEPTSSLASRMARAPVFEDDIAFVASRSGPALCEDLALCFWAGKPAGVDLLNLEQQVRRGTRSIPGGRGPRSNQMELVGLLLQRHYSVVQIGLEHSRLDPAARDALRQSYVMARMGHSRILFVPRDPEALTYK